LAAEDPLAADVAKLQPYQPDGRITSSRRVALS
jgi:hypothetical protein